MRMRTTKRLGSAVSEIGLGCWQLGSADWGTVSDTEAFEILRLSLDGGVTFIDTADVYGAGHSEALIGRFLKTLPAERTRGLFIASKLGRLKGYPDGYSESLFRECTQESVARLGRPIDLHQLHCVPPEALKRGHVFDWLRKLKSEGLIRHFGASVESMDEAKICLQHGDVDALQIIFNIFRQKPIDELFAEAKEKGVALIVRLPLASGLLAGKYTRQTTFPEKDHRHYNRDGKFFNVGETFAGLPFEKAVALTEQIKPLLGVTPGSSAKDAPPGSSATSAAPTMADLAIRWILDHDAITTIIPGATKPAQARANVHASAMPPLPASTHAALREFYGREVMQWIRGAY
jgi:aryl-alcohol dehydrogenase-like predicted oxidoreductase